MDSLLPILLVVVLGLVALSILAKLIKKKRLSSDLYRRNDELFSAAERKFLSVLDAAVAPHGRVFGKVRVADLVRPKPGLSPQARTAALNRVAQKHFDFVICSIETLRPTCAIELNDRSHGSERTKRRDDFLSEVCSDVGLPLVLIPAAGTYSIDDLRAQISKATNPSDQSSARRGA